MYPESIIQAFLRKFGETPAIIVRAPGRINLIGEHTDYNEGFVLPAAIDRAVWFAVSPKDDQGLHFQALDLGAAFQTNLKNLEKSPLGWPNYLLGCFSELLRDGHQIGGANVVFSGDIPVGAGLSSSAAVESGMLFALNELYQLSLSRPDLARLAQRSENNFVGMNCGIMDMFASLMGREGCALKLDCRSLQHEYIPLNVQDTAILLCDTGVKHQLVDSAYNTRRQECEEGVRHLQRIYPNVHSLRDVDINMLHSEKNHLREVVFQRCKYVVEENGRVESACKALKEKGLPAIGSLLYASHEGLKNEYQVSCPELDFLVDHTPDSLNFFGARMVGGGFGGCTINLLKKDAVEGFQTYIARKYREKWGRRGDLGGFRKPPRSPRDHTLVQKNPPIQKI
ncbi:MAG: galactokinase [Lewinellaceae bacterium]|nr:galactokinase [Lewinellaceae bacterium]